MSGSDKKGTKKGKANWAGRKAAQRAVPMTGLCQRCGKAKATQRHHRDGDTSNNAPGNLEKVCASCMQKLDANRWGWKGKK